MHLGLREPTLRPVYYALVLATIGLCAVLLRQLIRRNLVLSQVAVGGFLMVSISPISWSHHNVMFPLIIMTLVLDAFPLFFAHLPAWLSGIARVLTWVAFIGLYISPMWLGAAIGGGFNSLNHLAQYALLFSTVPILCLYAVMALWAGSALTPAVRIAQNRDRAVTAGPKPEPQAA